VSSLSQNATLCFRTHSVLIVPTTRSVQWTKRRTFARYSTNYDGKKWTWTLFSRTLDQFWRVGWLICRRHRHVGHLQRCNTVANCCSKHEIRLKLSARQQQQQLGSFATKQVRGVLSVYSVKRRQKIRLWRNGHEFESRPKVTQTMTIRRNWCDVLNVNYALQLCHETHWTKHA